MATINVVSNPQIVSPGDQLEHTFEFTTSNARKPLTEEKIISIVVTAGSFKINALGAIDANSGVHAAGGSSEKLIFSTKNRIVLFNLQGQTGTDTMIVSIS